MNHREPTLLTAYRSLLNHSQMFQPRKAAVIVPEMVISGIPATLYRASG